MLVKYGYADIQIIAGFEGEKGWACWYCPINAIVTLRTSKSF